jgi:N-acetylmuramoyl-L-alanine amidase
MRTECVCAAPLQPLTLRLPKHRRIREPDGRLDVKVLASPALLADGRARRAVFLCLRYGLIGLAAFVAACAPTPERIGSPSAWVASPSYNHRRPIYVVLHHTSDDTVEETLRTLTDPLRAVSSHYLVGRDGKLYQLVDERYRAWHAGKSHWGADADLNSSSIGIELDNNGREPFPPAQVDALLRLLGEIKLRYRIPTANFIGHADVSPGRKADPSAHFPWRQLARDGYGLWCDPPLPAAAATFDPDLGLQVLGYDLSNRDAAIRAFKLHFVQTEISATLTASDRDLIYCLLAARTRSREADQLAPQIDWPSH